MENYELSLTKQAEENIDETLETLIKAAQEISSSSERDFQRIKSKKWYKRLWEIVTFSKDNQKIQARGVSNLAKLNEITMKAIVLLSKQGKDTAAKVYECLNQISAIESDVKCLFDQQSKLAETILSIRRGFESEESFEELSSGQRDIIFAILRKYGGGNANEYTQKLLTSMRLLAHDTYGEVEYDIVETELKSNSHKMLFSLLHGYSMLLNDKLADETHEVFDYICLSENLKNKIKAHILEEIKTYGKSGYVRLFEAKVDEADLFVDGEDVQWEEVEAIDSNTKNENCLEVEQQTVAGESQNDEAMTYNIIITDAGNQKLMVLKEMNKLLNIGVCDAKNLLENTPSVCARNVDSNQAKNIVCALENNGATVAVELATENKTKPDHVSSEKKVSRITVKTGEKSYKNKVSNIANATLVAGASVLGGPLVGGVTAAILINKQKKKKRK